MTVRKEKVIPDYVQVSPDPKEDFYFDSNRQHLKITHQVLNSTRTTLYVKDIAGVISKVPARPMVSDRGDIIGVNTTYYSFTDKLTQTVHSRRYKITPSRVSKGRAVFIKELGMHFSIDLNFLKNIPVYQENDFADKQSGFISQILNNLQQCPIRIIINDPTEEMKNVYGIIDNRVYRIPIISVPSLGGTCIIQFASKFDDEAEQIFEFDIDELKTTFQQHGCMNPTVGGYNLLIYPTLLDAEEHVNSVLREQDKRTITVAAQEKEQLKRAYEGRITQLELTIKDKDQEIQGLKRILELSDNQSKREFEMNGFSHQEKMRQLAINNTDLTKFYQLKMQDKAIAREDAKVKKSELEVRSSELGMTTTVLKTIAAIAPIVLSVAGLYIAYTGSNTSTLLGSGLFKLLQPLLGITSKVSNILRTGLSWIARLFW